MALIHSNKLHYLILLIVAGMFMTACNSNQIKNASNGIPASVFRNSLEDLPKHYYASSNIENTLFRPEFINLLININREEGPLDIFRLRSAVQNWNTVTTGRNESINYNIDHFYKFAALGNKDKSSCINQTECVIDLSDIIIAQSWLRWQPRQVNIKNTPDFSIPLLGPLVKTHDARLLQSLESIYKHPVGKKLIEHALKTRLKIDIQPLSGKHGHYSFSENLVVIDPKVVNYEFNQRYLIHELVHASNQTISNSIEEEVFAEYIGLMIQNEMTQVPFEINPYAIFVDHVLHDEYGNLPSRNNIKGHLSALGIKL